MSEERDERALIARIRSGDRPAFAELIRPYQARVYGTVRRIVGHPDRAADVYQEAVLKAFEKLGDFRHESEFKSWLFRIAVNCALMDRRANKRNPVVSQEDLPRFNWMGGFAEPVVNWATSAESSARRLELRGVLNEALQELPEIDRTIVWLKDVEGLEHTDIAAATESTVAAVRTRLHRARLRLRQRLAHWQEQSR